MDAADRSYPPSRRIAMDASVKENEEFLEALAELLVQIILEEQSREKGEGDEREQQNHPIS